MTYLSLSSKEVSWKEWFGSQLLWHLTSWRFEITLLKIFCVKTIHFGRKKLENLWTSKYIWIFMFFLRWAYTSQITSLWHWKIFTSRKPTRQKWKYGGLPGKVNFAIDNRKKEWVLNDRPFGNALAVSFFRRCARLRAYDFHCSIQKRSGKLGRNVSFNESHVLYKVCNKSIADLKILIKRQNEICNGP